MTDTHKPTIALVATKREREATFALQMATQARKVGGRIAELRAEKGWKQRTLVERMAALGDKALNTNQLSRYENGGAMPGEQRQEWFATALDTTIADLVAGPVKDRKPPAEGSLAELSRPGSAEQPGPGAADSVKLDYLIRQQAELLAEIGKLQALLSSPQGTRLLSDSQTGESGSG